MSRFFIAGCQRSGTTLLRLIMSSHREIFCFDEQLGYSLLVSAATNECLEQRFTRQGNAVEGFKVPRFSEQLLRPTLSDPDFKQFPSFYRNEPVLFLFRQPRDVVASMMKLQVSDGESWLRRYGRCILEDSITNELCSVAVKEQYEVLKERGFPDHLVGALYWVAKNECIADYLEHELPVLLVSYEELVLSSRKELFIACKFLDVPWDEQLLRRHEQSHSEVDENGTAVGGTDSKRSIDARSINAKRDLLTEDEEKEIQSLTEELFGAMQGLNRQMKNDVLASSISFDRYSRYKACARLITQTQRDKRITVLDVGSGPERTLGLFADDCTVCYVDPLLEGALGNDSFGGNIHTKLLDGKTFDAVVAMDVLEHIPPLERKQFVERIVSLAENTVILAFPACDDGVAVEVDESLNRRYREVWGVDYPWLKEHFEYGLPSCVQIAEQLKLLGWSPTIVGHGHAPWLGELLGFTLTVSEAKLMKKCALETSKQFNQTLLAGDSQPPFYRRFVVARPNGVSDDAFSLPMADLSELEPRFQELVANARKGFINRSLLLMKCYEEFTGECGVSFPVFNRRLPEMDLDSLQHLQMKLKSAPPVKDWWDVCRAYFHRLPLPDKIKNVIRRAYRRLSSRPS